VQNIHVFKLFEHIDAFQQPPAPALWRRFLPYKKNSEITKIRLVYYLKHLILQNTLSVQHHC